MTEQEVTLAVGAIKDWVQAVTGRRFPADRSFRASLEDGVVLCELMERISPGLIRKINRSPSPIAYLDNVQQFLLGCKDLGLNEEQLFDMMDLQDPSSAAGRDERLDLNEKLKSVCVTLFWLSRAVPQFSGPQLNIAPFKTLVPQKKWSSGVAANRPSEDSLTHREEQTADQLLADIQIAVDEMLHDFQTNPLSPVSTPTPPPSHPLPSAPSQPPSTSAIDKVPADSVRGEVYVEMNSEGRGFGFQVTGGSNTMMRAQVDMVLPGSAAEKGGLRSGDEITSVNGQDVTSLKHSDLVVAIRKAGAEGHISMGLLRVMEGVGKESDKQPPPEEQQRHAAALKRMYPKSHQYLDSPLGPTLTPVLEEDTDLSPPLPPLPGELNNPLPPLPGEQPSSPTPYISPLLPLPGEQPSSPTPYISPLPPLPGESTPSDVLPEVAALASVRESVREMKNLQETMATSSPQHPSPPAHLSEEGEEELELTSDDLEAIIQDMGLERGEGEGMAEVSDQPWEPKTQWEDNVKVGETERKRDGKKGKIWSFLEEKTRISTAERAQTGGSKSISPPAQPPVTRKPPPPKVLPKPVRKKSSEQSDVQHIEELEVSHVNGPIPSPDPNVITIQSTSSTEPLNVRPVTGAELELHGDIKIQKVAHTRWIPQKKPPEQVHRTQSTPLQSSSTEGPPPEGPLRDMQQPHQYDARRYTGAPPTHHGAPPTHQGPIKQKSMPQFPVRSLQQTHHTVQQAVGLWQQQRGSRSQSQKLAEQTRVPPRGHPRGRIQSSSIPGTKMNGGPSYDSLSNVAREIRQQQTQQAKARSRTWGARERHQFMGQPIHAGRPALALPEPLRQDGLQQAFLVRPADPYLPCSLCRKPVGPQPPLIAIPGLQLHFHPHCFVCPVCHTYLAPTGGHTSTNVMVRNMRPHCHYCTSNTQGVQATEC